MGSWNGTCAISNLHVTAGQRVAVFLLLQNRGERSFCHGNALYDLCPIPFYGKYDDYGGVKNCEGFGLNIVVEAMRDQLYKFGQGPNEYHDIEVNKENFCIERLFEADHEGRLGVEDQRGSFDHDEYKRRELEKDRLEQGLTASQSYELDRLANKIKKVDTFRAVTHVIIHGDIFDSILEKWYIREYVGEGKGTSGYMKSYIQLYFKDLCDSIPEYVNRQKVKEEKSKAVREAINSAMSSIPNFNVLYASLRDNEFEWDDACLAGKWMNDFKNSNDRYGLIDIKEYINEYCAADDWNGLAAFVKEALTTLWINAFMTYSRKIWVKQSGQGSQNSDPLGYEILANAVLDIFKAERDDLGDDEDE